MVKEFGGRARFVSENYGDSQLAKRFGVTRYPAVFIDDVLVATPKDFGFYGGGEGSGGGRYAPFPGAAGEERFRADMSRMLGLVLAGRKDEARAQAPPSPAQAQASAVLPAVTITGLGGERLTRGSLAGRVVVLELWATWCPPCRSALGWLGELKKAKGDRLTVVAVAVESDRADVRKLAAELRLPFVWVMGTPGLVRALGDVTAVPTILVFDRQGREAAAFYGAPPDLHAQVEAKLAPLLN
ncbi:MAG: TlpA family protein disulfide reductase [Acidobacteria bacterium]|nr:TlpA family protein disulfide reductase [Acidobacteriota bacterium]